VLMHPQFMRLTGGDREPAIDVQGAANAYSKFWLDVLTPKISASPIQCL
jgi:hypothetical protein